MTRTNITALKRIARGMVGAIVLLVAGCAGALSDPEQPSRISVTFVAPEKFTDAKRSDMEKSSAGLLNDLQKFMIETGERYVPAAMRLDVSVTDVDLAGDFELFRGPEFDQVRITRGLYPPRIVLEFRLIDGAGRVLKEGRRTLSDIDYQLRPAYPKDDNLRYEKDILREWFRGEFAGVRG
jgi:hypothetical protein